ncbi:hypothetical protein GCM10023115_09090 [Pontixanthobacter gangjinensis]
MKSRELHVGITGHREGNRAFDANKVEVKSVLTKVLEALADQIGETQHVVRLVTCLAHGADMLAAAIAKDRGWQVDAPLPFGRALNQVINTAELSADEFRDALKGISPRSGAAKRNWQMLAELTDYANCFELAEQDDLVREALANEASPISNAVSSKEASHLLSDRSIAASMVMIEQSDVLVAIWDGSSHNAPGGTRDTISKALHLDLPVIWINPADKCSVRLLADAADLVAQKFGQDQSELDQIIRTVKTAAQLRWQAQDQADSQFGADQWRARSTRKFHTYRRIEAMFGASGKPFGSIVQKYEHPDNIAEGSGKALLDDLNGLPGIDPSLAGKIGEKILPRFAFADGLSTYLSDAYRGGMAASFLLSAAAIVAGIAYLPVVSPESKWPFALLEFILLLAIIAITIAGTRGNWHRRWFRTRRVAEYLRHAPILISLGCARALGRWPASRDEIWPEQASRLRILSIGLPQMAVTQAYLRGHLEAIIGPFLSDQAAYHRYKSAKLEKVHHNLDRMSEVLFILAVLSVGSYLVLKALSFAGLIDPSVPLSLGKAFTFMGVAFPTFGAALAGIRYFGDFERFAAISDVTATKLERLKTRADNLAAGGDGGISYRDYASLAHAMNDVVIEEIESWQSIFGTKKMAIPV